MQERWVSIVAAWAASMALGLAACGGGEPPPGTLFSADCPLGFCPESDTLGVGEIAPAYAVTWAGNALQIEARFGKSANLFAEVHLSGGDSVSATVDNVVVPLVDAQGYRAQWAAQWATVSATPVVSMLFHRGTSSWPSTVTVPARFALGSAGTVSAQRTQASLSVAVAPAVPEPLRLSISSGQCKRIDATVQEVKDRDVGYSTPGSGGLSHSVDMRSLQAALDALGKAGDAAISDCTLNLLWVREHLGTLDAGLNQHGTILGRAQQAQLLLFDALH